jgi:pimeloyl-ACP methyl ester carboxylesterase
MTQNSPIVERSVEISPPGIAADLRIPANASGLVIFAHGSGSSRLSTRNRFVAGILQHAGFATLLLDLLTAEEERIDLQTGRLRFDIGLLARRLVEATEWSAENQDTAGLPVAYFGASTGAAAALMAAADLPEATRAIVSRGGRPDLAGAALSHVRAPTLLIVGGNDVPVIKLNREAFNQLQCEKELEIVPRATHLFEEPGTLERVASLASAWFDCYVATKFRARSAT